MGLADGDVRAIAQAMTVAGAHPAGIEGSPEDFTRVLTVELSRRLAGRAGNVVCHGSDLAQVIARHMVMERQDFNIARDRAFINRREEYLRETMPGLSLAQARALAENRQAAGDDNYRAGLDVILPADFVDFRIDGFAVNPRAEAIAALLARETADNARARTIQNALAIHIGAAMPHVALYAVNMAERLWQNRAVAGYTRVRALIDILPATTCLGHDVKAQVVQRMIDHNEEIAQATETIFKQEYRRVIAGLRNIQAADVDNLVNQAYGQRAHLANSNDLTVRIVVPYWRAQVQARGAPFYICRGHDLTNDIVDGMRNGLVGAARDEAFANHLVGLLLRSSPALNDVQVGQIVARLVAANAFTDPEFINQIAAEIGMKRLALPIRAAGPSINADITREVSQRIFAGASMEQAIKDSRQEVLVGQIRARFAHLPGGAEQALAAIVVQEGLPSLEEALRVYLNRTVLTGFRGGEFPLEHLQRAAQNILAGHEFDRHVQEARTNVIMDAILPIAQRRVLSDDEALLFIGNLVGRVGPRIELNREEMQAALRATPIVRWGRNVSDLVLARVDDLSTLEGIVRDTTRGRIQEVLSQNWLWPVAVDRPIPEAFVTAVIAAHGENQAIVAPMALQGLLRTYLEEEHLNDVEKDAVCQQFALGAAPAVLQREYLVQKRNALIRVLPAFVDVVDRENVAQRILDGGREDEVLIAYRRNQVSIRLGVHALTGFLDVAEREQLLNALMQDGTFIGLNPTEAQLRTAVRTVLRAEYDLEGGDLDQALEVLIPPPAARAALAAAPLSLREVAERFANVLRGVTVDIPPAFRGRVTERMKNIIDLFPALRNSTPDEKNMIVAGILQDIDDLDYTQLTRADLLRMIDLGSLGLDEAQLVRRLQIFSGEEVADPVLLVDISPLQSESLLKNIGRKAAHREQVLTELARGFRRKLERDLGIALVPDRVRASWNRHQEARSIADVERRAADLERTLIKRGAALDQDAKELDPHSATRQSALVSAMIHTEVAAERGSHKIVFPFSVLPQTIVRTVDDVIPVDPADADMLRLFTSVRNWLCPEQAFARRTLRPGMWDILNPDEDRTLAEVGGFLQTRIRAGVVMVPGLGAVQAFEEEVLPEWNTPVRRTEVILRRLFGRGFEDIRRLIPPGDVFEYALNKRYHTSMVVAAEPDPMLRRHFRKRLHNRLQPLFNPADMRADDDADRATYLSVLLRGAAHCLDGLNEGMNQVCKVSLYDETAQPQAETIFVRGYLTHVSQRLDDLSVAHGGGETAATVMYMQHVCRRLLALPTPEKPPVAYPGVTTYGQGATGLVVLKRDLRSIRENHLSVPAMVAYLQSCFIAQTVDEGRDQDKIYMNDLEAWSLHYPPLCNYGIEDLTEVVGADVDMRTCLRAETCLHLLASIGMIEPEAALGALVPYRPRMRIEGAIEEEGARVACRVFGGDICSEISPPDRQRLVDHLMDRAIAPRGDVVRRNDAAAVADLWGSTGIAPVPAHVMPAALPPLLDLDAARRQQLIHLTRAANPDIIARDTARALLGRYALERGDDWAVVAYDGLWN